MTTETPDLRQSLKEVGIDIMSAGEFDKDTPVSFSISLEGLEGTGKTHFIMKTMPRPLVLINFGDRPATLFLYDMTEEERKDVFIKDIQPSSPDGWTFQEAVESLKTLNKIIRTLAPQMPGGTFALDGGSSWWSVMQQVFVAPKEQERVAAGKKSVGGIIYEEANNRVRGVLGHLRQHGCFLVLTHQMKQDWGSDGPIPGSFSPKLNSQIPYLVEVQVTLMKRCPQCQGFFCEKEGHIGRKHVARLKKLSGNTSLEGMTIESLTFPVLYQYQTGKPFPHPEVLPPAVRPKQKASQ